MNLIGRGGGSSRQRSPNPATGGPAQDQPASVVDYRRLVFISSDSSSGREEDDADSSCSSSSYLNGLPRNGSHHHAQSLEDCDWDYFESGSLPLPTTPIVTVGAGVNIADTADTIGQDVWSCCPGRGSAACQVLYHRVIHLIGYAWKNSNLQLIQKLMKLTFIINLREEI